MMNAQKNIKAPHETHLSCKGWHQEAAMRMLMNNLDPEMASRRLDRVLTNDPGTGIMRHADAGYELAEQIAREKGVDLPMK